MRAGELNRGGRSCTLLCDASIESSAHMRRVAKRTGIDPRTTRKYVGGAKSR